MPHKRLHGRLVVNAAWLLSLLLVACAPLSGAGAAAEAPPAPLLGIAAPVRLGADSATLLRSGSATFSELRRLIDTAHRSLHVEVYELSKPDLVLALVRAKQRGVDVTVIDDPSELSSAASVLQLRAQGVDVVDYPVRSMMIDHVKLLVVDARVAVVGGINWGVNSPANHDYDAEVEGPVVTNLDRVFLRDLVTCGRAGSVPPPLTDPDIIVAATLPSPEIRPLALALIDGAQRSLDLELFVLTDTGIVRALEAAHRRGVAIHVLLDPSQHPSDPPYEALLSAGVDVRWYRTRGELLHAKAIVADGEHVLFGSANWSGGGFARNHELDIEIVDSPAIADDMLQQMRLDWAASA